MDNRPGLLIVEDRSIVAAKIRRELERGGFTIAGMAATVGAANAMAERLPLLGAVLDIDLRGSRSTRSPTCYAAAASHSCSSPVTVRPRYPDCGETFR